VKDMTSDDYNEDQDENDAESPEVQDEESVLGSAPEEVEEIDETLESVGVPSDEDGPRELNIEEAIDEADQNQD
jgi:hypothetical protein